MLLGSSDRMILYFLSNSNLLRRIFRPQMILYCKFEHFRSNVALVKRFEPFKKVHSRIPSKRGDLFHVMRLKLEVLKILKSLLQPS